MTTVETTATRLAELTKQRADRKDVLDLPRTMTQREVDAYLTETALLDNRINAIRTAADTFAALGSIDTDTKWLGHLTAWRTVLCDELLTIKSPVRDRAVKEQADGLTFAIKLIDFGLGVGPLPIVTLSPSAIGPLMAAAGYATEGSELHGPSGWRGSLPEVEQRVKDTTKQRATAQAALDVLLRTDEERAKQEAEDTAHREVISTMRIKRDGSGENFVAFTMDGELLDLDEMTPVQRKAFERFEAANRAPVSA